MRRSLFLIPAILFASSALAQPRSEPTPTPKPKNTCIAETNIEADTPVDPPAVSITDSIQKCADELKKKCGGELKKDSLEIGATTSVTTGGVTSYTTSCKAICLSKIDYCIGINANGHIVINNFEL